MIKPRGQQQYWPLKVLIKQYPLKEGRMDTCFHVVHSKLCPYHLKQSARLDRWGNSWYQLIAAPGVVFCCCVSHMYVPRFSVLSLHTCALSSHTSVAIIISASLPWELPLTSSPFVAAADIKSGCEHSNSEILLNSGPLTKNCESDLVVRAFVSCCLDYCDALFSCLTRSILITSSLSRTVLWGF